MSSPAAPPAAPAPPAKPAAGKKKKVTPTAKTIAGAMAGALEIIAVWPLENLKTKLQLTRRLASNSGTPPPYTGMVSCFRYTVRTSGFMTLYNGMPPVLLASLPKAGMRFGVFEKLNQLFVLPDGSTTPLRTLAAGSSAGALESLFIVVPTETIKTKLVDLKMATMPGIRHIFRTEGLGGFYQGVVATTLKQGSNQGLRFMAFESYKSLVQKMRGDQRASLDAGTALLGGMVSGTFSTLCNNPFDVVKSRMQGTEARKLYTGFVDCFLKIVRDEGFLQLWSGTIPRLARVVPGQGIIFASSETIAGILTEKFNI